MRADRIPWSGEFTLSASETHLSRRIHRIFIRAFTGEVDPDILAKNLVSENFSSRGYLAAIDTDCYRYIHRRQYRVGRAHRVSMTRAEVIHCRTSGSKRRGLALLAYSIKILVIITRSRPEGEPTRRELYRRPHGTVRQRSHPRRMLARTGSSARADVHLVASRFRHRRS